MKSIPTLIITTCLAMGAFWATQGAEAQNPLRDGSLTATASSGSANTGETVQLEVELVDENGDPVDGAACSLTISEQRGSDAAVPPTAATTDDGGRLFADLNIGSEAGQIETGAECGTKSSTVFVRAVDSAAPPAAAPLDGITPPTTGNAGLAN